VSNLMLADDLVLFAEAMGDQAYVVSDCLQRFCAMSGQKISHEKSWILFSPNVNTLEAEPIKEALGIPFMEDLGKYLGISTLSKRVTKETFKYVIDRVHKRLSGWKTKCLSPHDPYKIHDLGHTSICDANVQAPACFL